MRVTVSAVSGIILLLLGIILLLANLFGLKINFFRLFPGVILLVLGIMILFGGLGGQHEVIFDSKKIDLSKPFTEKNIIFAEGVVDLNDLDQLESGKKMKINLIFSSGKLILNPEIPTVVHASTVFGSLNLAGQTVSFMGSTEYRFGDIQPGEPFLDIEANVIFGQLRVMKL